MIPRTYSGVKAVMLKKGYKFFENGDFNINLIFVREDDFSNEFTDTLHVLYKQNGKEVIQSFRCTTDAGDYYIFNKMLTVLGIKGTAVQCEGQELGAWTFADNYSNFHKSPALLQTKPIYCWRDNIADRILNRIQKQFGLFGLNIHRGTGRFVWNWSAGCLVIPEPDYNFVFSLIRESAKRYGNIFSRTILTKQDFLA